MCAKCMPACRFSPGHTHTRATAHFHYFTLKMLHFYVKNLENWLDFNYLLTLFQKRLRKKLFDLFLALVFTNLDWIQIGIVGAGVVCGCGVRPLQNQCAHTCVCGSESGCVVCVCATRKWVATHPLLIPFLQRQTTKSVYLYMAKHFKNSNPGAY